MGGGEALSHGRMKRSPESNDILSTNRLCTGLVRGSAADGRSAFSRFVPGSPGSLCGFEVPLGYKNEDGRGPAAVEVREYELGEGVRDESVVGEGVQVGDGSKRIEQDGRLENGDGTKISSGGVIDEPVQKIQQQCPLRRKSCQRRVFSNSGKDGEKQEGSLKEGASYSHHNQKHYLSHTESLAMLKNMVATQNNWLPETDKVTGLPMSKQKSPFAYEKRWKFMTWMVSEGRRDKERGWEFVSAFN